MNAAILVFAIFVALTTSVFCQLGFYSRVLGEGGRRLDYGQDIDRDRFRTYGRGYSDFRRRYGSYGDYGRGYGGYRDIGRGSDRGRAPYDRSSILYGRGYGGYSGVGYGRRFEEGGYGDYRRYGRVF